MSGLARIAAALILLVVVACGQGATPGQGSDASPAPTGPDDRPRLALVIGVSDYSGDITRLPNPVRDAELMGRSLEAVGFRMPVPIQRNATRQQMEAALTAFARALDAAGDDAIGLIYFAGHGMQVNGVNYLLPSDARRPTDLPGEAALLRRELSSAFIPAEELLLVLGSRPNGASILILDACRDNPLTRSIGQATRSGAANAQPGLYDMSRATGVLIAYATTPGDVSLDGNANNSPYAAALAAEMLRSGTVYEVFNRVRGRVEDETNGRQSPKETNGLRGSDRFCFGACPSAESVGGIAANVEVAAPCAQAEADWERISAQTSVTVVQVYADSIPPTCGALRGVVQARLNALTYEASQAFAQAAAQRTSARYREYLERYPGSADEAAARSRLASCRTETVQTPFETSQEITSVVGWSDSSMARDTCANSFRNLVGCQNATIGPVTRYWTALRGVPGEGPVVHCSAVCTRHQVRNEQRETCS